MRREWESKVEMRVGVKYEEFLELVDSKVGGKFERELARQLWD